MSEADTLFGDAHVAHYRETDGEVGHITLGLLGTVKTAQVAALAKAQRAHVAAALQ